MRPHEFAEQLRRLVKPAWVRPPATLDEIRSVEGRLGIVVPDDLRAFYSSVGGADEPTPLDNGWMTFWPLERWENGVGEAKNGLGLTLIADYGIESWCYGAQMSARAETPIFIVDGIRPARLVAASFPAFVAAALGDDRSIYAEPLERGAG